MANYVSDHTKFMREWMSEHPQESAEQKKGRALWWDKPQTLEEQKRFDQSSVPVKPYYYDSDH